MKLAAVVVVAALTALTGCPAIRSRPAAPGSGSRSGTVAASPTAAPRAIAPVGRIEEAPLGAVPPPRGPAPPVAEPPREPSPTAVTLMEPGPVLTQIAPSTPPNVAAALQLIEEGRRWQERGGRQQAREQFERAVAIDPTNAYGYFFLARVHHLDRNYDQAIAFASRAVAFGARLDPTWLGRIYALQGAVFEEAGRYPDARTAYRQAVATDPNNLAAQVGLVRVTGGADAAAPPP